jgi:hypothetical protein
LKPFRRAEDFSPEHCVPELAGSNGRGDGGASRGEIWRRSCYNVSRGPPSECNFFRSDVHVSFEACFLWCSLRNRLHNRLSPYERLSPNADRFWLLGSGPFDDYLCWSLPRPLAGLPEPALQLQQQLLELSSFALRASRIAGGWPGR